MTNLLELIENQKKEHVKKITLALNRMYESATEKILQAEKFYQDAFSAVDKETLPDWDEHLGRALDSPEASASLLTYEIYKSLKNKGFSDERILKKYRLEKHHSLRGYKGRISRDIREEHSRKPVRKAPYQARVTYEIYKTLRKKGKEHEDIRELYPRANPRALAVFASNYQRYVVNPKLRRRKYKKHNT